MARMLAVAMVGSSLLSFSAAGMALAGLVRDRAEEFANVQVASRGRAKGVAQREAAPAQAQNKKKLRRVNIGDVKLLLSASELRTLRELAGGSVDESGLQDLIEYLPTYLAEKVEKAIVVAAETTEEVVETVQVADLADLKAERRKARKAAAAKAEAEAEEQPTPEPSDTEDDERQGLGPDDDDDDSADDEGDVLLGQLRHVLVGPLLPLLPALLDDALQLALFVAELCGDLVVLRLDRLVLLLDDVADLSYLNANVARTLLRRGHEVTLVEHADVPLERVLGQREALSRGLEPYPEGWRASKPYFERTQALLEDPLGEDDWEGWTAATLDDLVISNVEILKVSGTHELVPGLNRQYQVNPLHLYEERRPKPFTPDEARLLGYLIGDGCVTGKTPVSFTNRSKCDSTGMFTPVM